MESCNFMAIARCYRCNGELTDNFERREPLISVKMNLSRRGCGSCNNIDTIQTSIDFCSFRCFWDCANDGDIVEAWERYCGDR